MIIEIVGSVLVSAFLLLGFPFFAVSQGAIITRTITRIYFRVNGDEERFSKWGLDKEMYGPSSLKEDILLSLGLAILLVLYGGYIYFWLVAFEADINEWYNIDSGIVRAYFTLWGMLLWVAIVWNIWRLSGFFSKADALNDLSEEFGNSYTSLDILSLYDSLRFAPSIYWEKFAATPVDQLTSQLLEKYLGYAEPYQHHHFAFQNKAIIWVAITVGLLAAIIAVVDAVV